MASKDDSVPVNPSEIGLDRATINENGQIQLPRPRSPDTSCHDPHGREADNHPEHGSTRASSARVLGLGGEQRHETMAKLKSTLQHPRTHSADIDSKAPVLADSTGEETGSRLVRGLPAPEKPTFQSFLHNPIKTAKSKLSKRGNQQAAAQIAAKEVPHGQEVDLVNASTAVERATTADEKQSAVQELSSLMEARQRTYVRWTLDRHISKVRVLPRDTFARKPRKEFETKGAEGGVEVDWKAYGHHVCIVVSALGQLITLFFFFTDTQLLVTAILCSKIRRRVHWLWLRSATRLQRVYHAQYRAPARRILPVSGADYDSTTSLPLGESRRNSKISLDLPHTVVLESAAPGRGMFVSARY